MHRLRFPRPVDKEEAHKKAILADVKDPELASIEHMFEPACTGSLNGLNIPLGIITLENS